MTRFDTFVIVDWSAASTLSPATPSANAIWIGVAQCDGPARTIYCRGRVEAETKIRGLMLQEQAAGRRVLMGFDFPFGYPKGFSRRVAGSDDPLVLWDWLAERITDTDRNENNRFDVAEEINAKFEGPGPLWGKPRRDRWPGVPFNKEGITFDAIGEKRACDEVARAASSCFQLFFNPTVGSQVLMGLPMLSRLRRLPGVAVWPFQDCADAQVVLAEVWPGLIETAVRNAVTAAGDGAIRDEIQVRLLARALLKLEPETLAGMMQDLPDSAREEAWILGAGHSEVLVQGAGASFAEAPDRLRNDCFALPPGVHWTPVDEALARLRDTLEPVTAIEEMALAEAAGRVLARDVRACRSNPPLPNTAVDGYGFAGARGDGLQRLPLVAGRAAAGDAPMSVPAGHAIRVLTGAALPSGVDTVVLQEDVTLNEGHIVFRGPVKQGANARRAGEDVAAGDTVAHAGIRIGAAQAALLAATGVDRVLIYRPLHVAVVSTGDELVGSGERAAPGQIFDANRPMLLEMIARFGHRPLDMGKVGDDRAALRQRLDAAAVQADAILTSGGASAGDEDHVSALLKEGGAMTLWRVAMKPGRPLALGFWNGKPVFGLPGNPVAAMVCALVFAYPALARLAGANWPEPVAYDVPAAFSKRKKGGRSEYLRARIRDGRVEVFGSEGSGRISGLAWAEGLVALPHQACEITRGDPVRYIPFSSFGLAP